MSDFQDVGHGNIPEVPRKTTSWQFGKWRLCVLNNFKYPMNCIELQLRKEASGPLLDDSIVEHLQQFTARKLSRAVH